MSVNLKVTLGTVNYTDFLHVTASKVSDPGVTVWETWIDVPVTNYNFIIPNLDPANYYVRYYDAPTNVALGTLVAELVINALTGDTILERKFYTVGGANPGDPANGALVITDTYLVAKNVTGVFKEGHRYYDPADEYTFDDVTGVIDATATGVPFNTGERIIVEIKYAGGQSSSPTDGGLYTGTLTVTAATHTLLAADINKRIRLKGTAPTQVLTLPALTSFATEGGFYFDNTVGGTAVQVKLVLAGANKILFNGLNPASNEFSEFWVSRGEHLLLRKVEEGLNIYWEVITDYKGSNVGEIVTMGFKNHINCVPEDGRLLDGDEYPRLWWWITNVLPMSHRHYTNTVTDVVFGWDLADNRIRAGQFFIHNTLKKFRMPNTQLLSHRALKNFEGGLSDPARFIDYPGGVQEELVGPHVHPFRAGRNGGINSDPNGGGMRDNNLNALTFTGYVLTPVGGTENRVKNTGVIFGRRI